jgi:glutaredoxin
MKKFTVISKKDCPKCDDLKAWLKAKKITYEEWKIEDQKVVAKLVGDHQFTETFCNIEGCVVYTPVIYLPDEGTYHFKELFGIKGIRENVINELLGLK